MAITVKIDSEDDTMTIKFSGSFTFDDWPEFAEKCLGINYSKKLYLDLSDLKRINVAGLGMILLMCEKVPKRLCKVSMIGCNENIEQLLRCVDFDRLITCGPFVEEQVIAA